MKKTNRILSIIFTLAICMSIVSGSLLTAFAENQTFGDFNVIGDNLSGVSFENEFGDQLHINTTTPLTISTSTTTNDRIVVHVSNANITLDGVNIISPGYSAIYVYDNVDISLKGINNLKGAEGIYCVPSPTSAITIKGPGSLNAGRIASASITITDNSFVISEYISGTKNYTNSVVFEGLQGKVYGNPTLKTNAEIPAGHTLTIPEGTTLTIASGITLKNNGTIINKGSIVNNGTINGTGTILTPPIITTTVLSDGTVDSSYSQTLNATGNAITWSIKDGSGQLPAGLNLNTLTGLLDGTPIAAVTFSNFTVVAENAAGKAEKELSITVEKAIPANPTTATASSITYGQPLADSTLTSGWIWANATTVPTVINSGYTAYYVIADDTNYDWSNIDGYNPIEHRLERTVSITVSKANQTTPTTPAGVNTSYTDTTDGKITGVDSTMEYRKDGETNYTAVTGMEIINLSAGKYYVRYAETANCNASDDKEVTISKGGKRGIAIAEKPTVSRVIIGNKLSDSVLTGGIARDADAVMIPGTFTWKNGAEVLNTKGIIEKTVIFTPDNEIYETQEFDVNVTVIICDTVSGEHEYTEQKNNTDKHWNICAKCGLEETGSREDHKGGTATCTAKAKCSVCDKEYGKMLDHKYDNGKCNVCNAADPNYVPNSPQTGDNSNMVLWLTLLLVSSIVILTNIVIKRKKHTKI